MIKSLPVRLIHVRIWLEREQLEECRTCCAGEESGQGIQLLRITVVVMFSFWYRSSRDVGGFCGGRKIGFWQQHKL